MSLVDIAGIAEVNDAKHPVRRVAGAGAVSGWVAEATRLPRVFNSRVVGAAD